MTRSVFAFVAVAAAVGIGFAASLASAQDTRTAAVTVRSSAHGRILFDGRGRALYAFTRDAKRQSRCSGDCARAWPPYVVRARPRAAAGVKQSLIGTTRRADRKLQATYAGRPLYFYVGDRRAGEVRCQNVDEFGGTWLVVRASGRLVR